VSDVQCDDTGSGREEDGGAVAIITTAILPAHAHKHTHDLETISPVTSSLWRLASGADMVKGLAGRRR
jgi:hypothetical protein